MHWKSKFLTVVVGFRKLSQVFTNRRKFPTNWRKRWPSPRFGLDSFWNPTKYDKIHQKHWSLQNYSATFSLNFSIKNQKLFWRLPSKLHLTWHQSNISSVSRRRSLRLYLIDLLTLFGNFARWNYIVNVKNCPSFR